MTMNTPRSLFLAAALIAAPSAMAQQHGGMDHSQMNQGQSAAAPMDHGAMAGGDLMHLHMLMMADSTIHAKMEADSELRASMMAMMPQMNHGADDDEMEHDGDNDADEGMDHDGESDAEDHDSGMMAMMHEHMAAMPAAQRDALVARAMAAHHRVLADPDVHARAMANPELRRAMEAMVGEGHGSMDHGAGHDG